MWYQTNTIDFDNILQMIEANFDYLPTPKKHLNAFETVALLFVSHDAQIAPLKEAW